MVGTGNVDMGAFRVGIVRLGPFRAESGRQGTLLRGCPPRRPRADSSSLMPLRRMPHRPDPVTNCGDSAIKNPSPQGRRAWGVWRSEIKEESAALGRNGGQSRSRTPQALRTAPERSTEVLPPFKRTKVHKLVTPRARQSKLPRCDEFRVMASAPFQRPSYKPPASDSQESVRRIFGPWPRLHR